MADSTIPPDSADEKLARLRERQRLATARYRARMTPEKRAAVLAKNRRTDAIRRLLPKEKERRKAAAEKWYQEHREEQIQMLREWRKKNAERHRNNVKEWKKLNRDKVKCYAAKRRSGGQKIRSTVAAGLMILQRGRCALCPTKLANGYHLDHIKALARGGTNEPRNLQLLCPLCNVRKGARDQIAFMRERGRLL